MAYLSHPGTFREASSQQGHFSSDIDSLAICPFPMTCSQNKVLLNISKSIRSKHIIQVLDLVRLEKKRDPHVAINAQIGLTE